MKKFTLILASLVGVSVAQLSCAAEQSRVSYVTAVYPSSDGTFAISLVDQPAACTSPLNPKRFHVKVGENAMTAEAAKQIYAAALMALVTDYKFFIVYDDSTANCFVNRAQIYKY